MRGVRVRVRGVRVRVRWVRNKKRGRRRRGVRTYLMMIVGMRMWMGMRKIQIVGGTGKKVWGGEHGKIGGGEFRSFRLLVVVVVAALPCPALPEMAMAMAMAMTTPLGVLTMVSPGKIIMVNYYFLWTTLNDGQEKIVFFCFCDCRH